MLSSLSRGVSPQTIGTRRWNLPLRTRNLHGNRAYHSDSTMGVLDGGLETNSSDYKENVEEMNRLVSVLNDTVGKIKQGDLISDFH